HYSLILSILLIQLIVAAFFYTENLNKKSLQFFEKQIAEVNEIEKLTNNSRKDLLNAQNYFQKYMVSKDKEDLNGYFNAVNMLTKNLDSINHFKSNNIHLKTALTANKIDSSVVSNLRGMIDSTQQFSTRANLVKREPIPELMKQNYDFNFNKYDVETKTYTDTIQKKGIFGRLKDAISGKVNVQKDSTVVTLKNNKAIAAAKMKAEVDSVISAINHHYSKEVQKIRYNVTHTKDDSGKFYSTFNNLLIYSNELMGIYDNSIKNAKEELQKEMDAQNSKNNKIRSNLVIGLMVLMFFVSILIMYFTRLAFMYEWKLNAANKEIKENLSFKNRILGMLSHELRSPLKIIGLFINRINKKNNDPSIKEYLKSISFTNNTLLMQANQILEYTKNQQVENKLIPVHFNLKNEIDSILVSLQPYVETRNNQFIINESIDPSIEVFSDNTKINQVIMNIVGNANKFTENGSIEVNTKAEKNQDNTVTLTTFINDSGAGISEADLKQIFEPYYQGVLSNEVENLGAGLGLSLCKELVELYGGKIEVTSEINEGTTVTFSLNLMMNS
ncbi:MAG: HAMP domain-containing histidine kinase, partial [Chryseobacterium sp.]|nr:HAMP domain-containing histidine kinase [Candidatus Chryseobacterium enterohippi]